MIAPSPGGARVGDSARGRLNERKAGEDEYVFAARRKSLVVAWCIRLRTPCVKRRAFTSRPTTTLSILVLSTSSNRPNDSIFRMGFLILSRARPCLRSLNSLPSGLLSVLVSLGIPLPDHVLFFLPLVLASRTLSSTLPPPRVNHAPNKNMTQ